MGVLCDGPDESKHTRLLFIGYPAAFEICDCSDLELLHEVLSINTGRKLGDGASVDSGLSGRVVCVTAVPGPRRKRAKDPFRGNRPLIGVLLNDDDGEEEINAFLLHSLSRHEVVQRATVADGAVEFQANEEFAVISTVDP